MPTYSNGLIPASALVPIGGGARLLASAAARWSAIVAEVEHLHGWTPTPTGSMDGYRPLSGSYYAQTETFLRRYTTQYLPGRPTKTWQGRTWWLKAGEASAAVPGTSNHGWGSAVDVAALGGFATTRFAQFAAVAARHGMSNTEGRSIGEYWHWVDPATVQAVRNGTYTVPSAPVTAPVVTAPAPIAPLLANQGDPMFIAKSIQDGTFWLVGPGFCHRLTSMAQVTPYQAGGLTTVELDNGDIGQIQAVSAAINSYTR